MQIQSKQKQTSLGGRFQTSKKDIFAQAYLQIAFGDGLFLGAWSQNIGGARAHPGPPLATPLQHTNNALLTVTKGLAITYVSHIRLWSLCSWSQSLPFHISESFLTFI